MVFHAPTGLRPQQATTGILLPSGVGFRFLCCGDQADVLVRRQEAQLAKHVRWRRVRPLRKQAVTLALDKENQIN